MGFELDDADTPDEAAFQDREEHGSWGNVTKKPDPEDVVEIDFPKS